MLAAIINGEGKLERLKDPKPLPQSVIDKAHAAIGILPGNNRVIAAQIRAPETNVGWLALWDDAVVLFSHTDSVEPAAIGALSICRNADGVQAMVRVIRARKTGEAQVLTSYGKRMEAVLDTATPVLAVIP